MKRPILNLNKKAELRIVKSFVHRKVGEKRQGELGVGEKSMKLVEPIIRSIIPPILYNTVVSCVIPKTKIVDFSSLTCQTLLLHLLSQDSFSFVGLSKITEITAILPTRRTNLLTLHA